VTENIPHLRIEREAGMVVVSQSKAGVVSSVVLHPTHLRHLAEQCGVAPTSDPTAAKQIATLAVRLRVLHRRIDELGHDLTNSPDLDHALEQALALAEIADAYLADLPAAQAQAP
jgi:hypothetical protein